VWHRRELLRAWDLASDAEQDSSVEDAPELAIKRTKKGGVAMSMERWRPRRGLTPWSPSRDLEDLQHRLEDFWSFWPSLRRFPFESREWVPAVDMYEKDDKYMVKAEVPGMKEEDVDVSVVGDRLTIKGEKKAESEVKEENYYRSERSYGSFFRSIDLPADADPDRIEASYDDGVLEVTIPKTAAVKPKKVKVSARKQPKSAKQTKPAKQIKPAK